ncbi:hypothetical protein [Streptomyces sp. CC208A]|uniref:hypothetical protein n=1 Tax=Streptomyces sp. CC208A TaxID=3044573 RepID=UPI0024A83050|nr:hypothetical protein [Streptomyces sp. CC208A]
MEDHRDIDLLHDAMARTADTLPPLPDLVPSAVREGRRRRARSRLAVGAAAFAVATAGALGLTLLPGTGPGVTVPVASSGDGTGMSGAERERREEYRRKMAALLDERLPETVTGVRPVGDRVSDYRFDAGGRTFRMAVSVRSVCAGMGPDPSGRKSVAELRSGAISELGGRVLVQYTYRERDVTFIVYADSAETTVAAKELSAVAQDPRFLELVKEADAHPMEENDPPLDPGIALEVRPGEVRFVHVDCQRAR